MKKNNILIIVFITIISGAGCSKVTDQSPISSISLANSFKTAQDAEAGVIACYDGLQDLVKYMEFWGDGRTDLFEKTSYSNTADLQIIGGNVDGLNMSGYGTWSVAYTAINRANQVLKFVPGIKDPAVTATRNRILAEAAFVRALTYYYLVRIFVNVPLITEPYTDITQDLKPKQALPDDVKAQIEKDLLYAESILTDAPYSSVIENKGRATLGSVRALMADFYLWQKKYPEALVKVMAIETSSQNYSLVPGASYITLYTTGNTVESIFEIQFNLQDAGNLLYNEFLPQAGTNPVYPGGGWSFQPSTKLKDLIAANDLRKTAIYKTVVAGVVNDPPFRNDATKPYINKHQGSVVGTTRVGDRNYIVYRLADIILMRAECLNETQKTQDAVIQLNRVIQRAGLTALPLNTPEATVRTEIMKQRFLELCYEGKRYFDLVRTGTYAAETGITNPRYLYWPIETDEIMRNRNLNQNEGY